MVSDLGYAARPCRWMPLWQAAIHELNAPLSVVLALTADLSETLSGDVRARESFAAVRRELARLVAVIDDLSWRSDLDRGRAWNPPAPLKMDGLLVELMRAIEAQHPERMVAAVGLADDLPGVLAGPEHFQFCLWTLLHNAARYSSPEFATLTLRIERGPDGRSLVFRVADDVPAVPPEYRERLFAPFPEFPPALRRPEFGLGLGLYAAREVARRLGGDLWLEAPGNGNVFALRLPVAG